MDFHVSMRTQPWPAELGQQGGGENRSPDCSSLVVEGAGCTHFVTLCYAQPLSICLIDSLVPVQGMLLNSLVTVLFSFWPEPLFLKMDAWSIMSYTAQGRFKDFLGQ